MTQDQDVRVVRELAKRYVEICGKDVQQERRDLWRAHNSLIPTRPPIYVRGWPVNEVPEVRSLQCEDALLRAQERWLRTMLYQDTIGDDYTFSPWLTVRATCITPPDGLWGLKISLIPSPEAVGSWMYDPPIKSLEDASRMVSPHHVIDEQATARNVSRLRDVVGDIIEVNVDRAPEYTVWNADISTQLAYLRGLEQVMWDMVDNPQWLHGVLGFMRDGIMTTHAEAVASGDWGLANSYNQAMPYAGELPDPKANTPAACDQLWWYVAAQEFTLVSPAMHDEFMLRYQLPIAKRFGLVAYGCCEDLSEKIDILRKIPNLRRIAVAPRANVKRCAEQIGQDYVFSYRPNPAEMVCCGFDSDHIRKVIRTALRDADGCHVDITLKDIQTVENHPERLREWVRIVREEIGDLGF
jgi:hypothetical protein